MGFVDDDRSGRARQHPAACEFVRVDDAGDAGPAERLLPLVPERRRHEAGDHGGVRPLASEDRPHRERDPGLAAPDRVREQGAAVAAHRRERAAEGDLLPRLEPGRRRVVRLLRRERPRDCASHLRRRGPGPGAKRGRQRERHRLERFSDQPRRVPEPARVRAAGRG